MVLANDLRCNEVHGVGDSDRSIFADLLTAAAIAAAGYNAARAVQLATDEWNMAKRYWRISQNWMDYYRDNYAPVEDQEIREALDLPVAKPEYDAAQGRARAVAWLQFKGIFERTIRCTSQYCTGLRSEMLVDLATAEGIALAAAEGLGYRNERAYVETRNDIRFEKMLNTAKRGRDMISDNVSLGRAAAGIYGDLFEQTWAGLEGAGQFLGYYSNRNKTFYPTTFLAGDQQPGMQNPRILDTSEAGEALMRQV